MAEIAEGYRAADARQAGIAASSPGGPSSGPSRAWGPPPAQPGALLDDWQQRAGLVGFYREMVGITDPKVAIGPCRPGRRPRGNVPRLGARPAAADEAALLKAMGQGDLEARVLEYERAQAFAPADVTAELDSVTRQIGHARTQATAAAGPVMNRVARGAEGLAGVLGERLARLQVADAARREWPRRPPGKKPRPGPPSVDSAPALAEGDPGRRR